MKETAISWAEVGGEAGEGWQTSSVFVGQILKAGLDLFSEHNLRMISTVDTIGGDLEGRSGRPAFEEGILISWLTCVSVPTLPCMIPVVWLFILLGPSK